MGDGGGGGRAQHRTSIEVEALLVSNVRGEDEGNTGVLAEDHFLVQYGQRKGWENGCEAVLERCQIVADPERSEMKMGIGKSDGKILLLVKKGQRCRWR